MEDVMKVEFDATAYSGSIEFRDDVMGPYLAIDDGEGKRAGVYLSQEACERLGKLLTGVALMQSASKP
jgi:hypothetical protein